MKAMILAAGLGTRMAPLTRARPKPALPILDEPMILGMVRQLAAQGVDRVVVNTHAHPRQLEAALAPAPVSVVVSREHELLGSAGGIRAARHHLEGDAAFLVLNADMRIDLDVAALREAHQRSGRPATLLLRDDPRKLRFGTIGYTETGTVCRITDRIRTGSEIGCGLFTGVQMMEPSIFDQFPEQDVSQLVPDVYVPLVASGRGLAVAHQRDAAAWWPVGTPAELLDANLRALRERVRERPDSIEVHPSARVRGKLAGPAWIGPEVVVESGAELGPEVIVGARSIVPSGVHAAETLFLADARPAASEPLRRAVAFDQEVWRDA